MNRLGRWLLNALAVCSLLLFVATIATWPCSYYHLRLAGSKDGRVLVAGLETNADAAPTAVAPAATVAPATTMGPAAAVTKTAMHPEAPGFCRV